MLRFYIKQGTVSFVLIHKEYSSEKHMNSVADMVNQGYDCYVDKDTDHLRWKYTNGKLEEISLEEVLL